jgi:hypothetical protein
MLGHGQVVLCRWRWWAHRAATKRCGRGHGGRWRRRRGRYSCAQQRLLLALERHFYGGRRHMGWIVAFWRHADARFRVLDKLLWGRRRQPSRGRRRLSLGRRRVALRGRERLFTLEWRWRWRGLVWRRERALVFWRRWEQLHGPAYRCLRKGRKLQLSPWSLLLRVCRRGHGWSRADSGRGWAPVDSGCCVRLAHAHFHVLHNAHANLYAHILLHH